jgi:Domain of unknown function (DUF2017)
MWRKRPSGPFVLSLNEVEASLLGSLLAQLSDLAQAPAEAVAGDPVLERLYPAAYEDPAAALEFRELTQDSLEQERLERYRACQAELPEGAGELVIEQAEMQRWLVVLNDIRLALGTRLGVSADGFDERPDSGEPAADELAARDVYHWLTAVQDGLVNRAMQ